MGKTPKYKDVSGTRPEESAASSAAPAARRPLRTLRIEDCSASIWARDFLIRGQPKTFFTTTFERSYKDRNGSLKYTKSFDPESLGKVARLCQQTADVLRELQADAQRYHASPQEALQ